MAHLVGEDERERGGKTARRLDAHSWVLVHPFSAHPEYADVVDSAVPGNSTRRRGH